MPSYRVAANTKAVQAALARVGPSVGRSALRTAGMAAGQHLADLARDNARSKRVRGALRARVEVLTPTSVEVAVSFKRAKASRTKAFMGFFMEGGTKQRRRKSGGSTGSMPAMPFLMPAWNSGYSKAQKLAEQALRDSLRGATRG